jgi:hypothetical protein
MIKGLNEHLIASVKVEINFPVRQILQKNLTTDRQKNHGLAE